MATPTFPPLLKSRLERRHFGCGPTTKLRRFAQKCQIQIENVQFNSFEIVIFGKTWISPPLTNFRTLVLVPVVSAVRNQKSSRHFSRLRQFLAGHATITSQARTFDETSGNHRLLKRNVSEVECARLVELGTVLLVLLRFGATYRTATSLVFPTFFSIFSCCALYAPRRGVQMRWVLITPACECDHWVCVGAHAATSDWRNVREQIAATKTTVARATPFSTLRNFNLTSAIDIRCWEFADVLKRGGMQMTIAKKMNDKSKN